MYYDGGLGDRLICHQSATLGLPPIKVETDAVGVTARADPRLPRTALCLSAHRTQVLSSCALAALGIRMKEGKKCHGLLG
jgi:hypothetical protein